MNKVSIGDLQFWQFENFSNNLAIDHFVTDRNTYPEKEEFTLSFSSSPDRDLILRNRNRLASALNISGSQLFFPSQIHKTGIVQVTQQTSKDELMDTDALITNEKGIGIAVMSADCVPILLFDKKNNAIGAVHSGWRGTVARILEKTLHKMKETFGTQGQDIIAGIGPSVSQDAYEVGEEVIQEVQLAFGKDNSLLIYQSNTKAKLDLWHANKMQLLQFGVDPSNIEVSNLCSVKNNHHFFSARKGDTGRYAASIVLRTN